MPSDYLEIMKNWTDPNFKFFVNREGSIRGREKFLLKDNNMKGEYLGACLDYIRWGNVNSVLYEKSVEGMVSFVKSWMDLNKENLIWHSQNIPKGFSLPYFEEENSSKPVLSLYEVLSRLKAGTHGSGGSVFHMDGWDLSFYVQKWHEQVPNGKAPFS